ncbi:MAG: response regulator transcription factor [Leptospira sp.]|nr:response regulator transcription factor [Leptospira sp.]
MRNDNKISILAVEDQNVIQDRIRTLLVPENNYHLFGICSNAETCLERLKISTPDILLVDLELPGMKGDELIKICREKYPNVKIVVFTSFEEQSRILRLLKLGIKGYILKDTIDELFIAELSVIQLGGASLTERVAQKILDEVENGELQSSSGSNDPILSEREFEVLNLISLGMNYKDIAIDLDVSPHTVRRHIENLYKKLEVNSKIQALEKAQRIGILNF